MFRSGIEKVARHGRRGEGKEACQNPNPYDLRKVFLIVCDSPTKSCRLVPGLIEILKGHSIIFALPAPVFPQKCELDRANFRRSNRNIKKETPTSVAIEFDSVMVRHPSCDQRSLKPPGV